MADKAERKRGERRGRGKALNRPGSQRLFSVEEVNDLIPRLELIMERLQLHALALRSAFEELARERGCPVGGLDVADLVGRWPDKSSLIEGIEQLVEEIDDCGGQFKGIDLGLIDFPAEIEGQLALLCWQYGEKEVSHWHSLDGGFAGRRELIGDRRRRYLQ